MKEYKCENCGKIFGKKYNYEIHINRTKPCNPPQIKIDDKNENFIGANISNEYVKKCLDESKCAYCGNQYTRKNNVIYHMKHYCKKAKEIEKEKHEIFTRLKQENEDNKKKEEEENRLKEIENKLVEKEKKLSEKENKIEEERKRLDDEKRIKILEEKNKKMCEENKKIMQMFNKLQKELKKSSGIKNSNVNSHNNSNNNNNNTINNQQNILLAGYKNEDLDRIDKSEILAVMKRGFQAPVELTRTIHFNPKYPEFHNIFIPKINEKYGMVFTNNKWRLIDKNDLIDDIYENKRDFIIQNFDNFVNQLDEFKKKSLKRWLNKDENDDESIINTKNDIKMLLFDNRHLAMNKKRIMDREARKLEIVHLPKKVDKREICDVKIESVSESSDTESDHSDQTYYSNYSYVKSGDGDES
jgi:hypothetical protein